MACIPSSGNELSVAPGQATPLLAMTTAQAVPAPVGFRPLTISTSMGTMRDLRNGVQPMRLPLNALLLRRGILPVNSLSIASQELATFSSWAGAGLEALEAKDYELLGASLPGDVVTALIRRDAHVPAWQRFIEQALSLTAFGIPSASLGAIVFVAVEYTDTTRWLAWTFGSGARGLRRSATDPLFGLLVALNALAGGQPPDAVDPDGPPPTRGVKLSELRYRTRRTIYAANRASSHARFTA